MARSITRPTFLFAAGATIAGCGLMYDYSDYADAPSIGGGGTATATTTTTTSLGGGGSGATGGTGTATTTTTTGGNGGTAGSGGTGGTGGTGGSGGTGPEICLDGIDNDDDGLTDCEDTEDCATADYLCAPLPEEDSWGTWDGPFLAFSGINPPGCLGSFPTDVPFAQNAKYLFVTAPPADVCECGCENPTATNCDLSTLSLRTQDENAAGCNQATSCGDVVSYAIPPGSGSCETIKGNNCAAPLATEVLSVELPQTSAGCDAVPRLTTGVLPPAFWIQTEDRICSSDIGVCTETGVESRCIPNPPGTDVLRVCVSRPYQSGLTCPDTYSDQVIIFPDSADYTDSRHCVNSTQEPCSCAPFNVRCSGNVTVYADPNCTGPLESRDMPPTTPMCAITLTPHARWFPAGNDASGWTPVTAGEQCTVAGNSVFTGTVTPMGAPPTTLMCCIPENG